MEDFLRNQSMTSATWSTARCPAGFFRTCSTRLYIKLMSTSGVLSEIRLFNPFQSCYFQTLSNKKSAWHCFYSRTSALLRRSAQWLRHWEMESQARIWPKRVSRAGIKVTLRWRLMTCSLERLQILLACFFVWLYLYIHTQFVGRNDIVLIDFRRYSSVAKYKIFWWNLSIACSLPTTCKWMKRYMSRAILGRLLLWAPATEIDANCYKLYVVS